MALELKDDNFDKEIKEFKGVALVDFWAPWCGPCKMQAPILDEVSKEMDNNDKVKVAKLNVEENKLKSGEYQVMSIPNLKLFKDGEVVEDLVGLQSKETLLEAINKHLK